jgi:eukaryotic-like serine/threonine-protein kinase
MPAQVTLAVTDGPGVGQQYVFTERPTALIGRAEECHIQFPRDKDRQTVSRHHCLLDINPRRIRLANGA